MSGCHKVMLFCRTVVGKASNKCHKLNPNGEICGKVGNCIHNWNPTRFGAR